MSEEEIDVINIKLVWRKSESATLAWVYGLPKQMTDKDAELLRKFVQDIIDARNQSDEIVGNLYNRQLRVTALLNEAHRISVGIDD